MNADERALVDFDHHSTEFPEHGVEQMRELRASCPVGYSEHHGGFWVVTRHEDLTAIARNAKVFSNLHTLTAVDGVEWGGVAIPPDHFIAGLAEVDPPEWNGLRRLVQPMMAPAAVEKMKPTILRLITECIDAVIATGRADLVTDIINPIPARLTMLLVGLSEDRTQDFENVVHAIGAGSGGDDRAEPSEAFAGMLDGIVRDALATKRAAPLDSTFLSVMAHTPVDGRMLSDEEILEVALTLILGGIGTTTAVMATTLHYLARHPEVRRKLIDDPDAIPLACEEFLRVFPPVVGLARTVAEDVTVRGQRMKRGDRVLLCFASVNRDDAVFADPDAVITDRLPNPHTTFGIGPHRCAGSNVARAELVMLVEQLLARMPDYRVDESGVRHFETIGNIDGYFALPVTFTPA